MTEEILAGAPEAPILPHNFSSPEEELKYLRERVAEKEGNAWQEQPSPTVNASVSQTLNEYAKIASTTEEHATDDPVYEDVVRHINSLPHREKMRELHGVIRDKGIGAAISLTRRLASPHIEDDLHRVLVGYVKKGAIIPGLDKEAALTRALHMTMYEVTLPHAGTRTGEEAPRFQDAIAAMERFVLGMLPNDAAHGKGYPPIAMEIVNTNFSTDLVFALAIPDEFAEIFVKQVLGTFPSAKIEESPGDYNPFNEFGVSLGSIALPLDNFVYPIAQADEADDDPLKVIIGAFGKIDRDGEGAAIQFVIAPDTDYLDKSIRSAIGRIRKGEKVSRATDIPLTFTGGAVKALTDFWHHEVKGKETDEKKTERQADGKADLAMKMMEEKITHPLLRVHVRAVASAATRERAETILSALEGAFNQFRRMDGNGVMWKRLTGSASSDLFYKFIYRIPGGTDDVFILNTKELTTLYHFPTSITQKEAPQLKVLRSATAPAPAEVPMEGTLIGFNKHRGEKKDIHMTDKDRLRHLYVIGQTGVGKTSILKNMIVEDIKAGKGVCFIDPHGSDVQDILSNIPKERIEDVIYFDPTYMPRPFGLNMLEYDPTHPEQKIFVVNELFSIFRKLYSATPEAMGPAFEQYFRNATMLVLEDPETGMTMLEISRVLADKSFRQLKLSRCKNPIVVQFWRDIAEKTSGEAGLANMIPYITNKFDVFLSNDVMRPIIGQEKSSFNFREIMDTKKIILVNLAKGKLGDINANLIGLILVGKILMAALSRVDSFGKNLPDFYLYIDEFQNITTDSISAILSEARKYGLSLNVAHQFIAQLDQGIKESVFGNVGSMAVFRIGVEDAQFLESQFAPIFTAQDLMKIDNYNCYVKMLMDGKPVPPFNLETYPPPKGTPEIVEQLKQLSFLKYGRNRETVDSTIMGKYLSTAQAGKTENPAASRLVTPPMTVTTPPAPPRAPGVASPLRQGGTGLASALANAGIIAAAPPPVSADVPPPPAAKSIATLYPEHHGTDSSPSTQSGSASSTVNPYTPSSQTVAQEYHAAPLADGMLFDADKKDPNPKSDPYRPDVAEIRATFSPPTLPGIQRSGITPVPEPVPQSSALLQNTPLSQQMAPSVARYTPSALPAVDPSPAPLFPPSAPTPEPAPVFSPEPAKVMTPSYVTGGVPAPATLTPPNPYLPNNAGVSTPSAGSEFTFAQTSAPYVPPTTPTDLSIPQAPQFDQSRPPDGVV